MEEIGIIITYVQMFSVLPCTNSGSIFDYVDTDTILNIWHMNSWSGNITIKNILEFRYMPITAVLTHLSRRFCPHKYHQVIYMISDHRPSVQNE